MQVRLNQYGRMADGIHLAADIYMPDGPGPFPVVLSRTPYGKAGSPETNDFPGFAKRFSARGYAFVVQDCRGRFESEGHFEPLFVDTRDGRDTVDWVANQSWCNGRIGLWGQSYMGMVQVPAASHGHEALRAIVPSVSSGSFFRDWIRYDGCFAFANSVYWCLSHTSGRTNITIEHFTWDDLHSLPGLDAIAARTGASVDRLRQWAAHDHDDAYWQEIDQDRMYPLIKVPGLHTGGWFDHLSRGQITAYQGIRDRGATEEARTCQRLVIGPWGHSNVAASGRHHTRFGAWEFGPQADFPVFDHELRFLDLHLRDIDDGLADEAPVNVFLMGANRWIGLSEWPPPEADAQSWYLESGNRLSREPPANQSGDTLEYDPDDPVPSRGGPVFWGLEHLGPTDQRPLLDRPDVLLYESAPLDQPMTVMGNVAMELTIASDAEDTDIVARLCVVEMSGAIVCLALGSLRCRYRDGWADPRPLAPNAATAVRIDMGHLAYRFSAGARLALTITSSDFPRILPHLNTMAPTWTESRPVVARNTILHGPSNQSSLCLPVLDVE